MLNRQIAQGGTGHWTGDVGLSVGQVLFISRQLLDWVLNTRLALLDACKIH